MRPKAHTCGDCKNFDPSKHYPCIIRARNNVYANTPACGAFVEIVVPSPKFVQIPPTGQCPACKNVTYWEIANRKHCKGCGSDLGPV